MVEEDEDGLNSRSHPLFTENSTTKEVHGGFGGLCLFVKCFLSGSTNHPHVLPRRGE